MNATTNHTSEVLIVERRGELPRVLASFGPLQHEFAEAFAGGFNTMNSSRENAHAVIRTVSEITNVVDVESFYQLSIVYPDGSEEISERCVAGDIAAMQLGFFNGSRPRQGRTMVARLLEPPRLASITPARQEAAKGGAA